MKKNRWLYHIINILIFIITMIWFAYQYKDFMVLYSHKTKMSLVILAVTVLLVHSIKACRLYFALYDTDIILKGYTATYCTVTPVSIILPYKLGEFYRMYRYGHMIHNPVRGIVIILLDRFYDTTALVAIMMCLLFFKGGSVSGFLFILLLFITVLVVIYLLLPGVYTFWSSYLLRVKASKNKLMGLKGLYSVWGVYQEISNVIKGKGLIMFALSLGAWIIEIGSLMLVSGMNETVDNYLGAALGGRDSFELRQFVFASVILLVVVRLGLYVYHALIGGKGQHESNHSI